MLSKVIKRNGTLETYDSKKIVAAIKGANERVKRADKATDEEIQAVIDYIENLDRARINVETIQDIIEEQLVNLGKYRLAKSYITYRYQRDLIRKSNTTDRTINELLNGDSDYWNNENSNKNAKLVTTQRDYIAGITSTDITKRFLLPEEIVKAHEEGIIHFHDADYFAQRSLHNCFSGNTKFITSLGVKQFTDFYDGESVEVLDKDGIWRVATVHNYGKKVMIDVTLKTAKMIKTVTCTPDHRWILKDGTVTTSLAVGDTLYRTTTDGALEYCPQSLEEKQYFCFGFILGDGTDYKANDIFLGTSIKLCGNKKRYLDVFLDAGYQTKDQNDGKKDIYLYKKGRFSKQEFLNTMGWKYLTKAAKVALFNGLYAADGSTANALRLATADRRISNMISDIAEVAGYIHTGVTEEIHDTNFKENALIIYHRFLKTQPVNMLWKVIDIRPHYDYDYEGRESQKFNNPIQAWCVEEPITHSFTLAGGVVTGNCDLVNLEDMLQNGTNINGVMIERPHRLLTATTIATQIITAVASSQYGGCSITLTHLAPFVRSSYEFYLEKYKKRNLTDFEKYAKEDLAQEIEAAVQTFNYQINSMSTTNGQAPFLTVFMYLNETQEYKDELNLLIIEFLKQRILGMKNSQGVYVTPAFPKLIYVLEEDNISKNTRFWATTELSAKCTAKRMVPDYVSEKIMKQLKNGQCFPLMGCRSCLSDYVDENGNHKFYGRFNQGVVTLNLVDVALSSKGDFDKFWKLMEDRTELCHRALRCRHERLLGTPSDVAPILWQHGALARLKSGEVIDKLLYGGYSTISLGYAGLYECVKYMTNKSHTSMEGKDFGLKVMEFMNDKCNQWKAAENIGYSVYGTPLESSTYKFATCLKKRFGEIAGVTDKDYITNSYHVPVFEEINAFDKLALEADFQRLSPGGAISYIETGDLTKNIEAVESVMQFIYNTIMYAELNTKSDYCQVCGSTGEIKIDNDLNWYCPCCGNTDKTKMNVARRTCGYIGTNFWNKGRTQEIKERYVHLDDMKYENK